MDVIFNCPKCEQELAVDSSGAGTEINCPSCGEPIVIPAPEAVANRPGMDSASSDARGEPHPINPIASSAAAKVEMHLRVPVRLLGYGNTFLEHAPQNILWKNSGLDTSGIIKATLEVMKQ